MRNAWPRPSFRPETLCLNCSHARFVGPSHRGATGPLDARHPQCPTPRPTPPHATLPQVLPIGGPSKAYTAKQQADLIFELANLKPKYFPVPVALMDGIISIFDFLAQYFPNLEVGPGST